MSIINQTIEMGQAILAQQTKYFRYSDLEDLIHISEMKATIDGIGAYLRTKNEVSEETILHTIATLQMYAQETFLERCAEIAQEAKNPIDEEGDRIYFTYIYQHGEYPE